MRCMVAVMTNSVQTDMERIRGRLNALLDRKGHGAVGDFAERVGVSRQYLARFRKGEDVGWQTLQAIRRELESEDHAGTAQSLGRRQKRSSCELAPDAGKRFRYGFVALSSSSAATAASLSGLNARSAGISTRTRRLCKDIPPCICAFPGSSRISPSKKVHKGVDKCVYLWYTHGR